MASLLTIPLELLVAISALLPTEDLGALRLVCKQTEKSLYEWFSQEFFTKKQFMLTHTSLQALVDISKHASFSKKLTHVIIATNVYEEIPLRFRDEEAAAKYIQGYEEQKALLSTGVDREMLSEAFSRLENLQTVGIRDFDSNKRTRDGKSWSSWGATTVYRETGVRLSFADRGSYSPEITTRFVSRIFSSVLYALGRASRQPPQFEVLLRQHGLLDSAFFLPDFLLLTIEPVLRNMTTLLLNVSLAIRLLHTHSNGTSADLHPGRSLRHFLRHTPNLTHLRLNFEKHLVANNEAFLSWLSTPPPPAMPVSFLHPDPIALPFLKTLELGQQSIRADILISLIAKFAPTLEALSLWRMNIHSFTHIPMGHQPNFWRDFFNKVSRIPQLNLTHLKVGMLQQDHSRVDFREKEGAKPLKVKEHTGKGMDKFWEELAEQVFVDRQPGLSHTNGDDSDGDEDIDGGEEEEEEDDEEEGDDDDVEEEEEEEYGDDDDDSDVSETDEQYNAAYAGAVW
ncbi:hypothetical protein COCMIDRAFT_9763 [Bipolaris oryzae ATCC 44560]|uniref:F-box domain-containing protein n=1 Tax=Bipolaris oryzae ATCC 44560 TaxID=930090 RepID=W6YM81_COCMI|nr:uncharacterized protein COCMIDRAFT_9763 [Bipolaris oryzae ATCC 44560]EUC40347.1 hypothetical protein COCMIDRAFT_9763 [Bipolaris oryzae ATCC 44560]